MQPSLIETIINLGLSDKKARLYLALLELGKATIWQLSLKSGLERTGIYYLLRDLRRQNLIRETYDKNNTLYIMPAHPEKLLELEKERYDQVKSALPELKALYAEEADKPKIQIFEGIEGLDIMYEDILAVLKKLPEEKREFLQCAPTNELLSLPVKNLHTWRKERIAINGRLRYLTADSPQARELIKLDKVELRETRILPKGDEPYGAAIAIYGDKVAQFGLKGEYFVLIIEHPNLARLQKVMFESVWKLAKA